MLKQLLKSPGRIILVSMITMIMFGTLLLAMPSAQVTSVGWIDCLFTATSAVCVTGLLVVPLSSFSLLGQAVIMLLIQIGAIGLITLTVFIMSLFTTMGLSAKSLTGEALELSAGEHPQKLAVFTILVTLLCESVGFILCLLAIYPYYPFPRAVFLALFHAISSFCSAGLTFFPLLSHEQPFSLPTYWVLLGITAVLSLVGEFGFIVWRDVVNWWFALFRNRRKYLTLHTRIILTVTPILIGVTFGIVVLLEHSGMVTVFDFVRNVYESLFNAICFRSAGFTTKAVMSFAPATLLTIMVVSFIGSSPGSTGSGIKITTFSIFIATIKATLLQHDVVEIKGRTIPHDQVFKAIAIVALSIAWVIASMFIILIIESNLSPFDCIFEVMSAFTNLGLSRGITPHLSLMGKIIFSVTMLVGRIGSLTALLALKRAKKHSHELSYPEERVMLG